jgi:hypothetical protein
VCTAGAVARASKRCELAGCDRDWKRDDAQAPSVGFSDLVRARVRRRDQPAGPRFLGLRLVSNGHNGHRVEHTPREAAAGSGRNWRIKNGAWERLLFRAWRVRGARAQKRASQMAGRKAVGCSARAAGQLACCVVSCVQLCPLVFALCSVVRALCRDNNNAQHNAQYCEKRKSPSRQRGWTKKSP